MDECRRLVELHNSYHGASERVDRYITELIIFLSDAEDRLQNAQSAEEMEEVQREAAHRQEEGAKINADLIPRIGQMAHELHGEKLTRRCTSV